jgi:hypothetical protein
MKQQGNLLEVENLCSRKLLELVTTRAVGADDLGRVIDELQARRHYLRELARELPVSGVTQH